MLIRLKLETLKPMVISRQNLGWDLGVKGHVRGQIQIQSQGQRGDLGGQWRNVALKLLRNVSQTEDLKSL